MRTTEIVNNIINVTRYIKDADDARAFARIYIAAIRRTQVPYYDEGWIYWNLKKVDSRFDF